MQGYSIGGYLNAVLRRSARTLLVEGVSDQSVFLRLKRGLAAETGTEPTGDIDTPDLLTDPVLEGLGNKDKISAVLQAAQGGGTLRLALEQKLGTLRDREWEGLNVSLQLTPPWIPPAQNSPHFTTRGHSVENYFFYHDGIEAFLTQFFSDHLRQDFFNALRDRYLSIVALAAIYSLAVRSASGLKRSDRLLERAHLIWQNDRYHVLAGLTAALAGRGVQVAADFHVTVNQNIDVFHAQNADVEPGRWLCHGHLGEQVIWAAVAKLAESHGVPQDVAESVERGFRDVKFRHAVDYFCRTRVKDSPPMQDALSWVSS